ncbi:hypothetical protein Ddye_018395, partial [Dipteronia dyeriana]
MHLIFVTLSSLVRHFDHHCNNYIRTPPISRFCKPRRKIWLIKYKPGILTDWPWTPLGNFKSLVSDRKERDLTHFLAFPLLLWRMLHNHIWISPYRYRIAKGNNRIVDKPINFDQVDRERNCIRFFLSPMWTTDGVILTILLHAGPVEFFYYWFHQAFHHHFLYSRYHSHHHSSIATEPIT